MPDKVKYNSRLEKPTAADEPQSAQSFWFGTISFGLVSIPVNLVPANQPRHIGLRLLAPDGVPLQRRYVSSKSGQELTDEEIIRGYEISENEFIIISDEELERLAPEKSSDIDLQLFVSQDTVPPRYFERGYFLTPAHGSGKAYQLLAAVMEKTKRAGIATFVMRGEEYLIAILAENGILRAETLRFQNELRSPADIGLPPKSKAEPGVVSHFAQYINKNTKPKLSTTELHDEAADELLKIVKKKQTRKENIVETNQTESGGGAEVINILDVLKRSLNPQGDAQPIRRKLPGKTAEISRGALKVSAKPRKKHG